MKQTHTESDTTNHGTAKHGTMTELLDQQMSDAARARKRETFPLIACELARGARRRTIVRTSAIAVPCVLGIAASAAVLVHLRSPAPVLEDPSPVAGNIAHDHVSHVLTRTTSNPMQTKTRPRHTGTIVRTSSANRPPVQILTDDELFALLKDIGQPAGLVRTGDVTYLSTELTSPKTDPADSQIQPQSSHPTLPTLMDTWDEYTLREAASPHRKRPTYLTLR